MPTNVVVVPLHLGAEEHARAETERKRQLLAWADHVLGRLGLSERVACANSLDYLRRITFDADAVDVVLAIREALHPASGAKAAYFEGLSAGGLKRILRKRFEDMKAQREAELRGRQGGS